MTLCDIYASHNNNYTKTVKSFIRETVLVLLPGAHLNGAAQGSKSGRCEVRSLRSSRSLSRRLSFPSVSVSFFLSPSPSLLLSHFLSPSLIPLCLYLSSLCLSLLLSLSLSLLLSVSVSLPLSSSLRLSPCCQSLISLWPFPNGPGFPCLGSEVTSPYLMSDSLFLYQIDFPSQASGILASFPEKAVSESQ